MNYKTFFNFLLFIILFYYLCYYCNNNYENFIKNPLVPRCKYCDNELSQDNLMRGIVNKKEHKSDCIYNKYYSHDLFTSIEEKTKKSIINSVGGKDGSNFMFICDENGNRNNYINKIDIRSGSKVDGLKMHCTNNIISNQIGSEKNGVLKIIDLGKNGLNNMYVNSGKEIDKITINNVGYGGSGGSKNSHEFRCNGGRINGIYGKAGARINNIGILCTK